MAFNQGHSNSIAMPGIEKNVPFLRIMHSILIARVLGGKPKSSLFLVNWENVVFIYSIFFII